MCSRPPGHIVQHGPFRIELLAQLIEIGDFQLGAQAHFAGVRSQASQQQIEQSGLAGAVGTDQADAVAAHDARREVANQRLVLPGVTDVLRLDHQLAGRFRLLQRDVGLAELLAALAMLLTQGQQGPHPALVAGAPRLDALPNPHFFLRQILVELGIVPRFDFQQRRFFFQETWRSRPAKRSACPRSSSSRRVANRCNRARSWVTNSNPPRNSSSSCFQPLDGFQIEMVGRLVQQQHVRLADQRPAQQHPPPPAAGQFGEWRVSRQLQAADHGFDPLLPAPAVARFQFML
jgi:hypothetical protein